MRYLFILLVMFSICDRADGHTTWTNTAGRAFTAELVGVTDQQATFVMADGSTNRLAITALSSECQATARRIFQLPVIPAVIRPTFDLTVRELRRIRFQYEDEKIDVAAYNDFRRRLLNGFRTMYNRHQLPADELPALEQRMLNASE